MSLVRASFTGLLEPQRVHNGYAYVASLLAAITVTRLLFGNSPIPALTDAAGLLDRDAMLDQVVSSVHAILAGNDHVVGPIALTTCCVAVARLVVYPLWRGRLGFEATTLAAREQIMPIGPSLADGAGAIPRAALTFWAAFCVATQAGAIPTSPTRNVLLVTLATVFASTLVVAFSTFIFALFRNGRAWAIYPYWLKLADVHGAVSSSLLVVVWCLARMPLLFPLRVIAWLLDVIGHDDTPDGIEQPEPTGAIRLQDV
ncbi:hypothetical protein [Phytoactinopolyspora endophytica]|uniref:hypothetical protein n=1 Tax=Phytoactinopolyspora endophytica TaxID=1642495 RepID=UPI00101D51F6|nr:hypothetical protein [Phytoactinopolyspora endophytica]